MGRAGRFATAAVGCALLASACGSGSSATKASTSPTTSALPATSAEPSTTDAPFNGGATTPTSTPSQPGPVALLRAVRASAHQGYDRLVFEFESSTPGYEVQYVADQFKNEDSGAVIAVAGSARVKVGLARAGTADISGAGVRETYSGPKRFTPDGATVISEVVMISDFEGTTTWAVGLARETAFHVQTLSAPSRVLVDFQS